MTTTDAPSLEQVLASDISATAFRLYVGLALRTQGEWVSIPRLVGHCNLGPYQARKPLAELQEAGLIEKNRRYERDEVTGHRTNRTYYRLPNDTSEASV
ncbi:hypothetical protein ACFWCA_19655 [Streptomyces phaeochromogenes]|uniref:hypothetical protein n=1 Tax=Streptomyces phaeochromogenes TaxID=1923 RepID=UPI0036BF807B